MNSRILVLKISLCFWSVFLYAQTLEGVVTDREKQPLEGVYVYTTKGPHTHTSSDGVFRLANVAVGDVLHFSHMSYGQTNVEVTSLQHKMYVELGEKATLLEEVRLSSSINAMHIFSKVDIKTRPVSSSQEVLRLVPGLFIAQHAGGGKAEQIFLRGFDVDHGTDVAISVEGMPVNNVSHAHGQGYADLHFLIPETIDKIDYGKGPYYADKGDFNTAGYVGFQTKDHLDRSSIKLEGGQFNTQRFLGMFNLLHTPKHSVYIASEYLYTSGPFVASQHFNRINFMGKYVGHLNNDLLKVSLSTFSSAWDASGQVPQRAVNKGIITRFGAIDPTEGGNTGRTNLIINYDKYINEKSSIKNTLYLSKYDFSLFSNFTFFKDDPVHGDEIHQYENRTLYGGTTEYQYATTWGKTAFKLNVGGNLRHDEMPGTGLDHVEKRVYLNSKKKTDITETNIGGYVNASFDIGKFSFRPALRVDYLSFQYVDKLLPAHQTLYKSSITVSPKLNILYTPSANIQWYLKLGKGFHSNDARVAAVDRDKPTLPSVYSGDVGMIWKPTPRLLLSVAYWYMFLEQEFVYVGDDAVVEPSGKTSRQGADLSLRYQPLSWLFFNIDVSGALGHFVDEPSDKNWIPLAPNLTVTSGLNVIHPLGFYGGINMRYMRQRPANEEYSIEAKGYTVFDLNGGYTFRRFTFGFQIQNLFNTDWNEAQFATETQLRGETQAVDEIHFTPGIPFMFKGIITYTF